MRRATPSSARKIATRASGEVVQLSRTLRYTIIDSKYGRVLVAMTEQGWTCCILLDPNIKSHARIEGGGGGAKSTVEGGQLKQVDLVEDLRQRFPTCEIHREQNGTAFDRIRRYIEDPSTMQEEEVTKLRKESVLYGTPFQIKVWLAMARIGKAKQATYGSLCRTLGLGTNSSRAVAQACGANPLTLLFPCHRVVGANGAVGGYHWGPCIKQKILEDERKTSAKLFRFAAPIS